MPSNRISLCLLAVLLFSGSPVQALPFSVPGDPVLRQQLQWLADRGCLWAPITTWPVQWVDVEPRSACDDSVARAVRARREQALQPGAGVDLRLAGANQSVLVRDFASPVREEGEVRLGLNGQGERLAVRLAGTWTADPIDGREWRADGSWFAAQAGNWQLGAGAVDRWWGPGWKSSLLWSNNARPVLGAWLSRRESRAPSWSMLEWVGPWSLVLFAGQLEDGRAVPDAKLLGARLAFRPLSSLEIGLSRMAQWGGEGRPEDGDSFLNMLVGRDNGQTSGLDEGEDPANQRAGMDFRWGFPVGGQSLAFYGQFIGEDEAGYLPSKYVWLAGMDWQFPHRWGQGLLYLEATDTAAGSLAGTPRYNVAFEHGTYRSGWRYRGRPLASIWGGDSRVATFGAQHTWRDHSALGLTISRASFNRDGRLPAFPDGERPFEPLEDRSLWLADGYYRRPFMKGHLALRLGWSEQALPAAENHDGVTMELGWERHWQL